MTNINVLPKPFEIGDDVVCLNLGISKVTSINCSGEYPIKVKNKNKNTIEYYTANGRIFLNGNRCLFYVDENVQVTITEPVYEYQVIYKKREFYTWGISSSYYKTVEYFEDNLNQYESIELFLPSKRLVQIL